MKFRLKLLWFEIEIETPAPEQVSTVDVVSAVFSAIANNPQPIVLMSEVDGEIEE
jgi:hypothetical protein